MSNNKICVLDNKLVEGRYRLSAVECRLIMQTISKIGKDDAAFKTHEYEGSELLEALGIGQHNRAYLVGIIEGLMKKTVKIRRAKSFLIANWLGGETEIFDDGRIAIKFSEKLKPYLLQLREQFTAVQFESMMQFKSVYSSRIYMLCKQYENVGVRVISIAKLKELLQVENGYRQFVDFKKRVLQPAEREINELSDIKIKIEPDRSSRQRKAYTSLVFSIKASSSPRRKRYDASNGSPEALRALEDERVVKEHERALRRFRRLPENERAHWVNEGKSNMFFVEGAEEEFAVSAWISFCKSREPEMA